MALNPIEILKDTISSVLHKITISSVVSLGDSKYRLNTSNTLYLRTALAKKFITIDAVDYFVVDFELNTYLTVKATDGSDAPVTVSSFSIDPPLFVWGNPQMVSAELVKRVANGTVIWPYMWIVELGSTSGTLDPAAAVKETRNFNIFFLDSADKVNWTIEQHYDNDIYTLNNYIDFFFKILKSRRDLFETDSITYTKDNQVNFGDYIVDSGMKEHILNGDITGIQLQVSIPYIVSSCAGVNVTPNCPVIVETFNGGAITSPVTQKAIVVQTDATTPAQTGNVLIDTDTQLTIEVAATSAPPINVSNLYKTGVTDSVRTGDDGDLQEGRGVDWFNLGYINPWGHGFRFVGSTGGYTDGTGWFDKNGVATTYAAAFPNDECSDWAYYNQVGSTVPMWYLLSFGTTTPIPPLERGGQVAGTSVHTAIDDAQASTQGGYSDWYLPNISEIHSIIYMEQGINSTQGLNYKPFEYEFTGSPSATGFRLVSGSINSSDTRAMYWASENGITANISPVNSFYAYFMKRNAPLTDFTF